MRVTNRHIARIPRGNLRVPHAQFAAVWRAAEALNQECGQRGVVDWYVAGVGLTCRWLAATIDGRPNGRGAHLTRAPVTRREVAAHEELIEVETLAAENLTRQRPDLVAERPGWCEGILATLLWAWRHEGPPPLAVPATTRAGMEGT